MPSVVMADKKQKTMAQIKKLLSFMLSCMDCEVIGLFMLDDISKEVTLMRKN